MNDPDDDNERIEPDEIIIGIAYGHPSGAVQAFHPETGFQQIGESPAAAVAELWELLKQGDIVHE